VGKCLGTSWPGNEEGIIEEFRRMEDKDKEIRKRSKEGA